MARIEKVDRRVVNKIRIKTAQGFVESHKIIFRQILKGFTSVTRGRVVRADVWVIIRGERFMYGFEINS